MDTRPTRRQFVVASAASGALFAMPGAARAQTGAQFGLKAASKADQSARLQAAIDKTAANGTVLDLSAGEFRVENIVLPTGARLRGVRGSTKIVGSGAGPIFSARDGRGIMLDGLSFDAAGVGSPEAAQGIVKLENCTGLSVTACAFANGRGNGLRVHGASGRIADNWFAGFGETALFATDSAGLLITQNTISDCANGGIRVFRYEKGYDGTIVTQNRITNIRSGSGNGQNGNGINVFLANHVLVADNVIADCDFSAVRLNSTDNCQVLGNNCRQCREVAIFSEFAFSGSIIANNLIADAATGISITNLDDGGRLAVCSGNIVRDITPSSPTNPDTRPVGIFAEADCTVTGNAVDNVPGVGIMAGWGPYLRNVVVSQNVVAGTLYGIGASVAEGAGKARITSNVISGAAKSAIAGFAWQDIRGSDLSQEPDQFANLTVRDNTVS